MTTGFEFYIDIEDAAGNRLGSGPITSANEWQYTARTDRAGSFKFEMPAADPKSALVQRKRKARAWAKVGGAWTEVGAGIIDRIDRKADADGELRLLVSGDDELRELAGRSVGWLSLAGSGAGLTHAAAVAAVAAAVATGWTMAAASSPANNYIYGRFAGESVLAALVAVADKTQTHFYRSGPRTLTFASAFSASGVRAIQAQDDLSSDTCAIVELAESVETFDLLTRIVPLGSGNGETRLTLAATSRTAPAGYTLNKPANYIEHDASVLAFGVIDSPWIEFKDVRPVSNTDADLQAAADMLFDQALKQLTRRAVDMQAATYQVSLAGCARLLRPLQTLRLVYRDLGAGIDVDQDVNILAATWQVTADGVQTTDVELSTSDLWPQNDTAAVVERIMEGTVYQAHPQLNANAYVIAYTKHLDDVQANPAQFRFRFDQEVTQLTRVCFDFQLLPLESTVKSVASSTPTSSASGDHTHSVTIAAHTHSVTIASHQHTITIDSHTHGVTIPNHNHSVTIASHTHDVTVAGHTHSVTIFDHTHGLTIGGHNHSVTIGDHTHTVSVPSHTHGVPDHQHRIRIGGGSSPTYPVGFGAAGTSGGLVANASGSDFNLPTNSDSGSTTTNSGGGSSPTSGSGGGTTTTSSSTATQVYTSGGGGGTTATSSSGGGTTATSTAGGGSSPTSSDGGALSTTSGAGGAVETSSSAGGGTTVSSTSGGGSTPTSASGGNHTHTVTPTITMEYGVFRDSAGNVFALGDLEYSLDGSTWFYFIPGVNGYASLGGGWNRIDITALVQNPTTLRPASSNNLLQIRRKLTGATGKKCTIDAQMSIRTIIQAIAFT
jgi:hypothetical protein